MKQARLLKTVILIITICSACTHTSNNELLPQLQKAESIMYEHPDSALYILQRMAPPTASDKLQHATWALLMTQARYKNYVEQDDSLINIAYTYFIKQEDAQRKALVEYYKGAICREHQQIEEAQKHFLAAQTEVLKTNDYKLAHLIFADLGHIYSRRGYLEYTLEAFTKAYEYANMGGNEQQKVSSLVYLARINSIQKEYDKSIEYYKQALAILQSAKDISKTASIMNELAGIYTDNNDIENAIKYTRSSIEKTIKSNNKLSSQQLFSLGYLYQKENKKDSAYYYYQESLKAQNTINIYTKKGIYYCLYQLAKENSEYEEALYYSELFNNCSDSIQKAERKKLLIEMQEKYDQQVVINEKNKIKTERDMTFLYALSTLFILCSLIAIIQYKNKKKLIKKEQVITKSKKTLENMLLQIQENKNIIHKNNQYIEELKRQVAENQNIQDALEEQQQELTKVQQQNDILELENTKLQKGLESYVSMLNEKMQNQNRIETMMKEYQKLHEREQNLIRQLVIKTPILEELKNRPKYVNEQKWATIIKDINQIFNNYTERLRLLIPTLTEADLQMCCLIKLQLPNPDIATILAISTTSVSKRKFRLKEHIREKITVIGKEQTLDFWLWNF